VGVVGGVGGELEVEDGVHACMKGGVVPRLVENGG
jgi:hypothetical protein